MFRLCFIAFTEVAFSCLEGLNFCGGGGGGLVFCGVFCGFVFFFIRVILHPLTFRYIGFSFPTFSLC